MPVVEQQASMLVARQMQIQDARIPAPAGIPRALTVAEEQGGQGRRAITIAIGKTNVAFVQTSKNVLRQRHHQHDQVIVGLIGGRVVIWVAGNIQKRLISAHVLQGQLHNEPESDNICRRCRSRVFSIMVIGETRSDKSRCRWSLSSFCNKHPWLVYPAGTSPLRC